MFVSNSSSYGDGSSFGEGSNSSLVREEIVEHRGGYEPILDMALSRQERERIASEVLLGRRSLLPLQGSSYPPSSRNGWGSVYPMGSPQPPATPLDWGSRPSTTKNSNYDKIVTSPFDPRYPKEDAPVAEEDFIVMNGLNSLLPTTRASKKEVAENNKMRLVNKSPEAKAEVMETLLMVEESKEIGPLRLRKARLAADAKAKKAALDKMKMDKLLLSKQVADERTRAIKKMKESVISKKAARKMLRTLSQTLTKHMNSKSPAFPQVLRTCVSSGNIPTAVSDPMSTFKVPPNREFDITEHIASGDEARELAWNGDGNDERNWGDDDKWDEMDSLDGVELQVSKER